MRCINATCGRPLTKHETRQGHTRCGSCRRTSTDNHPFNGAIGPAKRPPALTSWWTAASREHFTDHARVRLQPPALKDR